MGGRTSSEQVLFKGAFHLRIMATINNPKARLTIATKVGSLAYSLLIPSSISGSLTSVYLEGHTPAPFSENSNTPVVQPGTSSRKTGSRGIKSRELQHDHERQRSRRRQTSHERQYSQGRLAQELRPSKEPQPAQALQSSHAQQPSEKHQDSQARHPSHARQPSREHQGSCERHTYPSEKGSMERKQRSRERPREQAMYTAQNGTRFGADELRRLAHGVKISGNVKVYFIPCFIGDPWKDVKPVPCIRPPDLMSRF
ncbi:uncharacterized protein BDW70DRAFT_127709 [Aspergillus foveolatus]|uniref:uncharacterized protein n=1 Tax=Aspergillus foveolatus TaxID=210207 RepID=UPI003CCCE20A